MNSSQRPRQIIPTCRFGQSCKERLSTKSGSRLLENITPWQIETLKKEDYLTVLPV